MQEEQLVDKVASHPHPHPAGLFDMLSQFLPGETAQAASGKELPYRLLRRAEKYEVREYPQHVAVATDYERRVDGLGTLSAYTNGANEIQSDILPYVPSLMAVTKEVTLPHRS